jgi:hypothetical protein
MLTELLAVLEVAGGSLLKILPISIAFGVIFPFSPVGPHAIQALRGGASAKSRPISATDFSFR